MHKGGRVSVARPASASISGVGGSLRGRSVARAVAGGDGAAEAQSTPTALTQVGVTMMATFRSIAAVVATVFTRLDEAGGGLRSPSGLGLLAAAVLIPDGAVSEVLHNQVFMTGYFSWLFAQLLKVPTHFLKTGVWRIKAMVDAGGMPSSHSSLCMGITTAVAVQQGLSSALFPVCLGFSLIVMYDAAGVRRHAGKQAEVINRIMSDCIVSDIPHPALKEVLGHTPLQVLAGAILGIAVGIGYSSCLKGLVVV